MLNTFQPEIVIFLNTLSLSPKKVCVYKKNECISAQLWHIIERQAKTELDGMYLALLVHMLFVEGLILRVLSTGLLRVNFQRSIIVALRWRRMRATVYVTFLQEIIKQEALEEKQKNLLLVDWL